MIGFGGNVFWEIRSAGEREPCSLCMGLGTVRLAAKDTSAPAFIYRCGECRGRGTLGRLLDVRQAKNLVVDTGLDLVRDLIGGTGFRPDSIAVGTDNTSPTAGDTALGAQVHSQTIDRRIKAAKSITLQVLIGQDDANAVLSEQGVFEGPILVARSIISPSITKTSSIEITIAHQIDLTAV